MSLRSKMLAMATIPLVVLIVTVVYAVAAQTTASRTNAEVDRTNTVRQLLSEIQDDLAVAESNVRGYLLTGRAGMRTDYEEAVAALRSDLTDLDVPLLAELQRTRLDRLRELVDERLETFRAALGVGSGGTPHGDERLVTLLMHGQTITDTLRGVTEQMRLDRRRARRPADLHPRRILPSVLPRPGRRDARGCVRRDDHSWSASPRAS